MSHIPAQIVKTKGLSVEEIWPIMDFLSDFLTLERLAPFGAGVRVGNAIFPGIPSGGRGGGGGRRFFTSGRGCECGEIF